MAGITYDYHALKAAHAELSGTIDAYETNAKTLITTGDELVADNNAEGVKSTMTAFQEKQEVVVKIMQALLETISGALANARELHVANGGDE